MAFSANPFALKNLTLDAQELRQALSSLLPDTGGLVQSGDLAVTQTGTPSMNVLVGIGRIWIPGQNTANLAGETYSPQGHYFGLNDASQTLAIATANATNPRIDVVYAAVKDTAFGQATDQLYVAVVTGTPAATPAVPSLPTGVNAVALANVAVAANATSITNANITPAVLPIVGREILTATTPAISNWTTSGSWYSLPFGAKRLVVGQFTLNRSAGAFSLPGGGVAYTTIGTIGPASMLGAGGSVVFSSYISGNGAAINTQCNYNTSTGALLARADTGTPNWPTAGVMSGTLVYLL